MRPNLGTFLAEERCRSASMIAVGVGEDDHPDRFVTEFAKHFHDASAIIDRYASVDDRQSIVAFNHRNVGRAEADSDEMVVGPAKIGRYQSK